MTSGLDRAARVLREETAVEADGAITRQRIEAAWLRQRARPQAARRLAAIVLVTLVLGGGALAATGVVVRARVPELADAKAAGSAQEHRAYHLPSQAARPFVAPSPQVVQAAPAASPQPASPPLSAVAPRSRAATVPALSPTPSPARRVVADATAVYAAAHEAHFVARHWSRALALWSRYLRLAPHGPLAPEAHFNRAICLVHLGRDDDAAIALQAFANGRPGDYRQQEARRLLDAMGGKLPQGPSPNK